MIRDEPVVLKATGVVKHFRVRSRRGGSGTLRAVDGVDLEVRRGETVGLVGESGCGKSTLGRCLVGLTPVTAGSVALDDRELVGLSPKEMRPLRREMQMVFQDPFASLNPRKRVQSIVGLSMKGTRRENAMRVQELLELVGLRPEHAQRFPHEFSGGQRQRIGVARALAPGPRLIVADEPVSALDVSIQAQIVNLFADLQETLGLSYVFVAHDLSVVRQISDRIAVMYLGKVVEIGAADDVVQKPRHPYTESLLSSVPSPNLEGRRLRDRIVLQGDVPSPLSPPAGCRFHPRCRYATDICRVEEPLLVSRDGSDQLVACHHPVATVDLGMPGSRVSQTPNGRGERRGPSGVTS
jgi:oligopeptide/dipeptide ABC transporter ATP-binding protein